MPFQRHSHCVEKIIWLMSHQQSNNAASVAANGISTVSIPLAIHTTTKTVTIITTYTTADIWSSTESRAAFLLLSVSDQSFFAIGTLYCTHHKHRWRSCDYVCCCCYRCCCCCMDCDYHPQRRQQQQQQQQLRLRLCVTASFNASPAPHRVIKCSAGDIGEQVAVMAGRPTKAGKQSPSPSTHPLAKVRHIK